jgi:CTP synthase (UTP-ammonia lyase)
MRYIALLGEYDSTFTPHVATGNAIRHSSAVLRTAIEGEWVSTQDIDESLFSRYSGLWVTPGSPYKNLERTIWALEHARKNNVPLFRDMWRISAHGARVRSQRLALPRCSTRRI